MAPWKRHSDSGTRFFGQSRSDFRSRSQCDRPTTLHALQYVRLYELGLHRTRLMKGVLRARSRFALSAGIDYDNYRSYRHVKTYRGRLFSRVQPTWSADLVAALRSASPRNTALFSLAIHAVVPVLP